MIGVNLSNGNAAGECMNLGGLQSAYAYVCFLGEEYGRKDHHTGGGVQGSLESVLSSCR